MKEEAKSLLTMKGTLKSIARVSDYIEGLIEAGNSGLEEKIIESKKTISDCWKYITSKAKDQVTDGSACIEDEEVYGWAVHYFEELSHPDGYDVPKPAKKPDAAKAEDKTEKKSRKKKGEEVKAEEKAEEKPPIMAEEVKPEAAPEMKDAAPAETAEGLPDGFIKITEAEEDVFAEEESEVLEGQLALCTDQLIPEQPVSEPEAKEEEDPIIDTPEEVLGENRCCAVCGKKMMDAFSGTPVETIRKWTESWLRNYGEVFCCKDHMTEFLSKKEAAV